LCAEPWENFAGGRAGRRARGELLSLKEVRARAVVRDGAAFAGVWEGGGVGRPKPGDCSACEALIARPPRIA
jgi:hypothetical protein